MSTPPECVTSPTSQYVNNATLSDITFIVEGRKFHAHRIALLASSDAFNAMFSGGYREKEASSIDIPNIPWDVFESMMRYIYTGSVEVQPELANELLQAADQYLLDGLKGLCEMCIAKGLTLGEWVPGERGGVGHRKGVGGRGLGQDGGCTATISAYLAGTTVV